MDQTEQNQINDLTDAELLVLFLEQRDQEAFSRLVHKYSALVMSVCRQYIRDQHEAEDLFQSVFLILARKADTIKDGDLLASWIYRVACREAFQSSQQRKKKMTVEYDDEFVYATQMAQHTPPEEQFQTLHEEIENLPEKYRGPVVLCYLNGMTRKEAAAELKASDAAVKARLSNGRKMLKERLMKRGVALAAVIAAWETAQAEAASLTTSEIVHQTVEHCLNHTNAGTGAVASSSSHLTEVSEGKSVMSGISGTSLSMWIGGTVLFVGGLATGVMFSGGGGAADPAGEAVQSTEVGTNSEEPENVQILIETESEEGFSGGGASQINIQAAPVAGSGNARGFGSRSFGAGTLQRRSSN